MVRYLSGVMLALCLFTTTSAVEAQVGEASITISLATTVALTVTQNGQEVDCSNFQGPEMTQSQTYTLAPVIGSALSGHLDFQCGDIVISVDHLLTTTAAGTKGAGIVQPTAYTHQITAVVKYPDGTVAPLIDRSYDLSLPDWPVTSKGIGALKWDTDILPEPGIKWRYLVDEWTCEAAE